MNRIVLTGLVALVAAAVAGCPQPQPAPQQVPPTATIVKFSASPAQVEPGSAVTLEWDTELSTHVSIRRRNGALVPVDEPSRAHGSVEVTVDADEVFLLTARGEGGSDSAAAAVAVVEKSERQPLFAAVPDDVPAGQPVSLVWSVPGEGTITVKDGSGAVVYEGPNRATSRVVRPTSSQTYTLTADGRDVTVTLTARPVINAFTAAQTAVALGDDVTLQWSVLGASEVTLTSEGRGALHTESDPAAMADGSFTEAVDFVSPTDGLVRYVLSAQANGRTVSAILEVGVGVDPVFTEVSAPAFAREGGQYTVSWKTGRANRVEVLRDGVLIHVAQSQADVAQGLVTLASPATEHTLTLRAHNARGGTAVETRTVRKVGEPLYNDFYAAPSPLPQGGDPVYLTWDVTNARRVRVSIQGGPQLQEVSGLNVEQGSIPVYPNKQTTYVLNADNMVGDAIAAQTVTVDVTNPARLVFSPSTVPAGTPIQITGTTPALSGAVRMPSSVLKNLQGDTWVELVGNGGTQLPVTSGDDTVSYLINLPELFTTQVMGTPVSSQTVNVSINGWMNFASATFAGPTVPSATLPQTAMPHLTIAPFAKDLVAESTSRVLWRVDGTGLDRRLIVQWEDVPVWNQTSKRQSFQAHVYQSGKIVFAYKNVTGWIAGDTVAIGLQNHDSTAALVPASGLLTNGIPATGERLTFGGEVTLPVTVTASTTPVEVQVEVAPGTWLVIQDAPNIIPPNQFGISEINHNPATGQAQWFEVRNNTAGAIDLAGWVITFAPNVTHTIAGPLLLPANGHLVFGQTANAAESATVHYVYGTGFTLPAASGTLTLGIAGGTYSTVSWTAAGTAGVSLQVDPPTPGLVLTTGNATRMSCASTAAYGSNAQLGTPGTANTRCFPYVMSTSTAHTFASIAATGTLLSSVNGDDTFTNPPVTLPRAVNIFGQPRTQLWVSSEGFVSWVSITSSHWSNVTTVSNTAPNGMFAPFWDDLAPQSTGTLGSGFGVYWQQFDPDATPSTGDEYTVFSWENWRASGATMSLNFQVRIDEGTGDVFFLYGAMTGTDAGRLAGNSATTWVKNGAGTAAVAYNRNSATAPGILPNSAIRFAYTP